LIEILAQQIPNVQEFREEQKRRYAEADERARQLSMQASTVDDYEDTDAYRQPRPPSPPAKDDQENRRPNNADGNEEQDLSKIPRGDAEPKTGKEEKEELMKKHDQAGKRSNKVEYRG
jgi:hypothetical protein